MELTHHNIADLVRDKVRQTILDSIPDEQIDKLIMSEWEKFFNPPTGYSSDKRSQFERLVHAEIEAKIKERTKEWIAEKVDKAFDTWNKDESYHKMIKEMVPSVTEGYMMNLAGNVAQQISNANNGSY